MSREKTAVHPEAPCVASAMSFHTPWISSPSEIGADTLRKGGSEEEILPTSTNCIPGDSKKRVKLPSRVWKPLKLTATSTGILSESFRTQHPALSTLTSSGVGTPPGISTSVSFSKALTPTPSKLGVQTGMVMLVVVLVVLLVVVLVVVLVEVLVVLLVVVLVVLLVVVLVVVLVEVLVVLLVVVVPVVVLVEVLVVMMVAVLGPYGW